MGTKPTDVVSASEIASWEWCPEAWRLGTLGNTSENESKLARGESFHASTARLEVSSRHAVAFGRWLVVCGIAAVVVALVLSKVVGQ